MAQSDYLKQKKMSTILSNIPKLDPVLKSKEYTNFLGYSLDKQIQNTKIAHSKLIQNDIQRSFDMDLSHTNLCEGFDICNGTNDRPNRVPLSTIYIQTPPIHSSLLYQKFNKPKLNDTPVCKCSAI